MAELVDALVSGASAARCRSSNLLSGTKKPKKATMYNTILGDATHKFSSIPTDTNIHHAPFCGGAFFVFPKFKHQL